MAHPISTAHQQSAAEVLRKNGRSFHFARAFLTKEQGDRAARLYSFCRYIDDLADEATDKRQAKEDLDRVHSELSGTQSPSPQIADFLALAQEVNLEKEAALALVGGVASDLETVAFQAEADLMRYAYNVAGTVGLMMCGILEVEDARAAPFAIDLGVAMQLTNIARDIHEDAMNGRRYIPASWVEGASATDIANPSSQLKIRLQAAARRLIELAENYYESAADGFGYLPGRSRFAILIAARVYRQIGLKLRRQQFSVWRGRIVVSTTEKVFVSGVAASDYLMQPRLHRRSDNHNPRLHDSLRGLAGAHEDSR